MSTPNETDWAAIAQKLHADCRKLERELAAMKAERDALKNAPREIICTRCGLREQQGIVPPADF